MRASELTSNLTLQKQGVAKNQLDEKTIFDPHVNWVSKILSKMDIEEAGQDIHELADLLTDIFSKRKIAFEVGTGKFGAGVYKDKLSAKTGLVGAEFISVDSDPQIIVVISKAAARLSSFFPEFDMRLKQLIKHEYIHKQQLQKKIAGTGNKNASLGSSPELDHRYYADPYEVSAITSEIETQLLQIEPNPQKLISMLKIGDKRLQQSDRYRLYLLSYKEDPLKFKPAYTKMIKELIHRLEYKQDARIKL